jgi:radical SAM protein with 4Fe4S-binding SPASM domain
MINVSKLYCGRAGQSDDLRYSLDETTGPVVVYNCTNRCNLNCLHCYSSSADAPLTSELNTKEALDLIARLTEIDCPVVLFSGGEPLLREDLFDLLNRANRVGLRTVLSTNGTLIDEKVAEKLALANLSYVGISIDGDKKFHDHFRQTEGSFQKAIDAVKNCAKFNLRTGLRFTITKLNAEYVPYIFDLAASLGVRRICFYHLIRVGRAGAFGELALKPAETRLAIDAIIEKTNEYVAKNLVDEVLTVGNHCDGPYILLKLQKQTQKFTKAQQLLQINGGNRIGEKLFCVGPDGNIHPDQFWRNYSLGSIKDQSLKKIWQNPNEPVLKKLRNKQDFADRRCLSCTFFNLCKGSYRFLTPDPANKNWLNEPACYLNDNEIKSSVL